MPPPIARRFRTFASFALFALLGASLSLGTGCGDKPVPAPIPAAQAQAAASSLAAAQTAQEHQGHSMPQPGAAAMPGPPMAVGLTTEQQKKLLALKEHAATANATAQRKVDQSEGYL